MKSHRCMAFKHCEVCRKKYCLICEDTVHSCKQCVICKKAAGWYCPLCGKTTCGDCFRTLDSMLGQCCVNCFKFRVNRLISGDSANIYKYYNVKNICFICGDPAVFKCICEKKNICIKCSFISAYCSNDCKVKWCPRENTFTCNKCSECYNVFTDEDPLVRKTLITILICLKGLPKPLRLLICEFLI